MVRGRDSSSVIGAHGVTFGWEDFPGLGPSMPATYSGKYFYVDKTNGSDTNDGESWQGAKQTIQGAVDVAGDAPVGDVIWVAPAKYTENVTIQDHEGLKIFAAVPGWPTRIRASDATTKVTYTSLSGQAVQGVCFAVLDRGVEIAGFLLDGGGNYAGAYVGDGYRIDTGNNENSASVNLHHNIFYGAGEGEEGLTMDGCSDSVLIHDNLFTRWDTAAIYISAGGTRTVQRPVIRDNVFIAGATSYGIDMYSSATTVGCQIIRNSFADYVSEAFTYAVRCQGAGVHSIIRNDFACANMISASSTDFCAGNTQSSPGNVPLFTEEEAAT